MSYSTTIRLIIKNVNKKTGFGTLNFEISFSNKETKQHVRRHVNLKEKILAKNFVKGKIKNTYSTKALRELVDKKKVELQEKLRKIELEKGELSPTTYDEYNKVSENVKKDILTLFDDYVEEKKKRVDYKTIQKYMSLKNALSKFIESEKLNKVYLSNITIEFLENFTNYLSEERELGKNTINKYQSDLIAFLDALTKKKINKNLAYKEFKKIPRDRESNTRIVLLKEHIKLLIDWQPTNQRYEIVRDLFLFQIFTGIRFSDLERVTKSWVKNDKLVFVMYKTAKKVNIPIHDKAKEILEKYDYEIGTVCKTIQNYNSDLKEVGRLAGITETIDELKIKLNSKIPKRTEMYKLLSSHVGRSSFITNLIVAGVSPYIIMGYTGHSKITTLDYYFKLAGDMDSVAFEKFKNYLDF